jgi:hypothetical protein
LSDVALTFNPTGNIPKQLARFDFAPEDPTDPLSPVVASVYPSLSNTATTEFTADPVFRARLVVSRRLPSFPLNLALVPRAILDPRLFQAPLCGAGQAVGPVVGTEQWCSIAPSFAGEVRVLYPEPGLEGGQFGDGFGFPDVKTLSVGLWWPKVSFEPIYDRMWTILNLELGQDLVLGARDY